MRTFSLIFTAAITIIFLSACVAHGKYGEFDIQAINTVTGISAGMSKNGELLILSRNDERQAIYVAGNRIDNEKIFNCSNAPFLYLKVHFFGRKNCSILRVELPDKKKELKFYRHREVANKISLRGKKVWVLDLKEVSPDGKELRVVYEVENQPGRKTGTYYPATNTLMAR